jgi:ABC-type dipeptide/oligopeptide/nickel transport system permease component
MLDSPPALPPTTEPVPALAPAARRGWALPPLAAFILKRLLQAVPVFIGVTFICFAVLMLAPGDPVRIIMGQHYDPEVAQELRVQWGLDRPFLVQYGMFLGRLAHADLGYSYTKRTPVAAYLGQKFANTLLLTLAAMVLAVATGLAAGISSAARPRSLLDYGFMLLAVAGISIPVYWLGLMLQLLFATRLGWLPPSDMSYPGNLAELYARCGNYPAYWWQAFGRHFVLPAVTLATVPMAIIARLTRSSMLEVMSQDYIRTARAKGLSFWRVVLVHGLRNALIPIVTVVGNNFAVLLTGAVLTETVFAWPGLGRAMVDAIHQYDYPVVLGGVMLMASVFIVVNLVVDLTYGLIDPRVRYG